MLLQNTMKNKDTMFLTRLGRITFPKKLFKMGYSNGEAYKCTRVLCSVEMCVHGM